MALDEKRRLDARIAALVGKLEEEQTQSVILLEQARKSQINIEQLSTELASERGSSQKMENTKMKLERQNKELKAKLEESENSNRARVKAAIAALESKVSNLEEQLPATSSYQPLRFILFNSRIQADDRPGLIVIIFLLWIQSRWSLFEPYGLYHIVSSVLVTSTCCLVQKYIHIHGTSFHKVAE